MNSSASTRKQTFTPEIFPREKFYVSRAKMSTSIRSIPGILQRPKVLMSLSIITIVMFLSVITIFFAVNRSKDREVHMALVTFKGIQRKVPFEKGYEVQELIYLIKIAYSTLLERTPPVCVKLYRYGESDPLSPDFKLQEDISIEVKTKQDEACHISDHLDAYTKEHKIEHDTPYRLWNPVSNSLLQRIPNSPGNEVDCNGNFSDKDYVTVVRTDQRGADIFAFTFTDHVNKKTYVLNATDQQTIIAAEISPPSLRAGIEDSMKFKASYYWSFTLFKSLQYSTQYLGCGKDGKSNLVYINPNYTHYPTPGALFIANTYILPNRYIPL